jgi:hypothetical protein
MLEAYIVKGRRQAARSIAVNICWKWPGRPGIPLVPAIAHRRIRKHVSSTLQVLRMFSVPCEQTSRITSNCATAGKTYTDASASWRARFEGHIFELGFNDDIT